MKVSKGQGTSLFAAIVIFGVLTTLAFLAPLEHTITFWLGYFFAVYALITVAVVFVLYFAKPVNEEKFLSLPAVKTVWVYYLLQTALSLWQMIAFPLPYLLALTVNLVLAAVFSILTLVLYSSANRIGKAEQFTADKVIFIKQLKQRMDSMETDNAELDRNIKALSEDVRFSDPLSHSKLQDIEDTICELVDELSDNITDEERALSLCKQIRKLLKSRNDQCKIYKGVKDEAAAEKQSIGSGNAIVLAGVGATMALFLITLTICLWVIPNNKYEHAMTLYEAERYVESIVEFEKVKGFRKSDEMIVLAQEAIADTVYQEAQALLIKEQYEEAIIIFTEIEDYKDSKEMIVIAQEKIYDKKYQAAKALLDGQKYDEAILAFREIENYKDSKDMILLAQTSITEDKYTLAEDYFNKQNYVEAIKLYKELGDYKDAQQKIEQINNRMADEEGIIYYGTYNGEPIAWQIVKAEDDKLMLIAKDAITNLPYNNELKNVEWGESSLCRWLNTEFITSFSNDQVASIITTEVDGAENKVFLLSEKEFKKIKDKSLVKSDVDWWLCTKEDSKALFVEPSGKVNEDGENVVRAKGVRPCIWVSLEE